MEHALGAHFHACGGTDDTEGPVGGGETADGVALKIEEARRIEQVDLRVHPLGMSAAEIHGVSALDLFRRGVGECGAVRDVPVTST